MIAKTSNRRSHYRNGYVYKLMYSAIVISMGPSLQLNRVIKSNHEQNISLMGHMDFLKDFIDFSGECIKMNKALHKSTRGGNKCQHNSAYE